jgi:hypothetical protein
MEENELFLVMLSEIYGNPKVCEIDPICPCSVPPPALWMNHGIRMSTDPHMIMGNSNVIVHVFLWLCTVRTAHYVHNYESTEGEAEFLDESGIKVSRVFLLAIHSHL